MGRPEGSLIYLGEFDFSTRKNDNRFHCLIFGYVEGLVSHGSAPRRSANTISTRRMLIMTCQAFYFLTQLAAAFFIK